MTLARRFMSIENRGRGRSLGRSFEKPRPGATTSKTQIFGSARVRTWDASLSAGKQRNDTTTQAFHRLANRSNVRFRYDLHLQETSNATCGTRMISASGTHAGCSFNQYSNSLSAATLSCRSGGRLDWELLAIYAFVVLSFATPVIAAYAIWAKCDCPPPF